ncbi:MAG: glycosyltransferase [Thermoleophilia bacterium]|nr:glycosyltransferase [Thermoleophilia bacterium]
MSDRPTLRIALISPHAWPPRDDVSHRLAAEAGALARRGHRVTILAPATRRDRIAAGRQLLLAAQAGDADALSPPAGEVLEVAVGRALPAGAGRRVGEPFDLSATLETVLSRVPFDVVHLHEPLAPSPALAALRHAPGVTAATFHRAEPLAGVAFLRPLIDRALARADLRIATTEAAREALSEILPGEYAVVAPGVDAAATELRGDGPPGLVLIARGRDRVGVRFALGVLRGLDLDRVGPVTLLGPADAPWRTRAAVPKALRDRVEVVPDGGPAARAEMLGAAGIALVAAPEDAAGPVLREAMAAGCAVLVPRCAAVEEAVVHGVDALVLPQFTREPFQTAITELTDDPGRRALLQEAAAGRGRSRSWDDVAADLEGLYRGALDAARVRPADQPATRVVADLHVRAGRDLSPDQIVVACAERGIDVVCVTSPDGLGPGRAAAAAAPPSLSVIVGQEIATTEGALVGLFLTHPVAAGLVPEDAAAAVHAQGGLVMVPHPDAGAPPAATLRRLAGSLDLHQIMSGADDVADPAAPALRRLGLRVCAGSGATRPQEVGTAVTELPSSDGAAALLDALDDGELRRNTRRGATHEPRTRGRRHRTPKS